MPPTDINSSRDPMDNSSQQPIVLYDEDCFLCRSFAAIAGAKVTDEIHFESWQSYKQRSGSPLESDKLRVLLSDGTLIEAEEAWEWLLREHSSLKPLGWMAEKLGITKQTARAIRKSGDAIRRFCRKCKRS